MANPFDYTASIMQTKVNLMRDSENDVMAEADYNPWLANLALSQYEDCILLANVTNQYYNLPKRAQYELLLAMVRPKKRTFRKWAKPSNSDDLDLICDVYQCNKSVAHEYLQLLSSEQLDVLRQSRMTGGRNK